ncbi:MAG TPA: heavy metal-binding domain-containing protein [Jatrophihabitans sp.]|nr:heavy metal-binding domain-containing protein [Jatrophihabitans sp.]
MTQPPAVDLSQYGIPADAARRIAENADGTAGAVFTSDLSVNEFLLVRQAGFRPLGLVMGSSVYHIGAQFSAFNQSMELSVLTQAMYHARELAMTRMRAEAYALGGDGVVGVRLKVVGVEWGEHIAEFTAIGTAVKAEGEEVPGGWRDASGGPFTSDLSGQDFWTLVQAGYAPLGLVMGTCVYHMAQQGFRQIFRNLGQNVEIPQYTQGVYDARELAMGRMQAEARSHRAEGIVGVQLSEHNHVWGFHTTEFFAVGTAVRPVRAEHTIAQPNLVMPLS